MADLTIAQRRILATCGLLTEANKASHEHLGGHPRPAGAATATHTLSHWWSVRTTREADRCLEWLANEGHRAGHDPASGVSGLSMFAWDFARIASVAGWSYLAYLLDLETAWRWMKRAALALQPVFGSFAEFGQHYIEGLGVWCEDPNGTDVTDAQARLAALCSREDSPFRLPWDLDITATPPPAAHLREVHVEPGTSIRAAIAEAGPGGRVVIHAGRYRESLRPEHAIELCASGEDEILIESEDSPVLWAARDVSVFARGLSLRSGRTADDKPLNAVHVVGGFARLEACEVSASHAGVFTRNGRVQVVGSHVYDCGHSGVTAEPGEAIVIDSRVHGVKRHGVACIGGVVCHGAPLASVIEGSHVSDTGETGIVAEGQVVIRDTKIERAAQHGVLAEGEVELERSTIAGAMVRGLQVGGSVRASETTIEGSYEVNVAVDMGYAALHDCTIGGGPMYGLFVRGGARALLTGTTLADHAKGNLHAVADAGVVLHRCTIRGGLVGVRTEGSAGRYAECTFEGAEVSCVEIVDAGGAVFTDCVIRDSKFAGVVFHPGASARFSRCKVAGCAEAGFMFHAGARPILEDCEAQGPSGDYVPIEPLPAAVSAPVGSDARLRPVEEHEARGFAFRFNETPGVAAALAARGGACDHVVLANAVVNACERAGLDMVALGFTLDEGLIVSASERGLVERARDVAGRLVRTPVELRAEVDRVELAKVMAMIQRPPSEDA
jgi:hypothetical protein